MHAPGARPQRHDRVDEEVQRDQDVAGDIDLDEGVIQAIGVDLRRANRDEHVDGIERAEDDQGEPGLAVGKFGDVEQVIDMIRERAVSLPGIERTSFDETLEILLPLALGFGLVVGSHDAHAGGILAGTW
jgi:hypothetical protein